MMIFFSLNDGQDEEAGGELFYFGQACCGAFVVTTRSPAQGLQEVEAQLPRVTLEDVKSESPGQSSGARLGRRTLSA
jgi:hypothetical protein